jgi:hypothetical protein
MASAAGAASSWRPAKARAAEVTAARRVRRCSLDLVMSVLRWGVRDDVIRGPPEQFLHCG